MNQYEMESMMAYTGDVLSRSQEHRRMGDVYLRELTLALREMETGNTGIQNRISNNFGDFLISLGTKLKSRGSPDSTVAVSSMH